MFLQAWQAAIDGDRGREMALANLRAVDDPDVIPAVAAVFAASTSAWADSRSTRRRKC